MKRKWIKNKEEEGRLMLQGIHDDASGDKHTQREGHAGQR
jgi:hypothetical protein